jgi:hypothetical protein
LQPPGQIVCAYFVLDKFAIAIYIGAVVEKGGKGFRQASAAAVKAQKSAVPPLLPRCFPRCYVAVFPAVMSLFLTSNWYRKWLKIKSLMMLRRKSPQPRIHRETLSPESITALSNLIAGIRGDLPARQKKDQTPIPARNPGVRKG